MTAFADADAMLSILCRVTPDDYKTIDLELRPKYEAFMDDVLNTRMFTVTERIEAYTQSLAFWMKEMPPTLPNTIIDGLHVARIIRTHTGYERLLERIQKDVPHGVMLQMIKRANDLADKM